MIRGEGIPEVHIRSPGLCVLASPLERPFFILQGERGEADKNRKILEFRYLGSLPGKRRCRHERARSDLEKEKILYRTCPARPPDLHPGLHGRFQAREETRRPGEGTRAGETLTSSRSYLDIRGHLSISTCKIGGSGAFSAPLNTNTAEGPRSYRWYSLLTSQKATDPSFSL